ncbi:MAG TPA: arsenate reductase (glutaredoxin) [Gammaproteobacteria bacterium]|nr:arsenate reductase (glutaredoxin) [Gammaproteobacteria bacterium]
MDVRIYHNPRCSKSRQTLELLRQRGIEPVIVEYLKTPPSIPELEDMLEKLSLDPRQLMRTNEPEYKTLGLDQPERTRQELIQALHDQPQLLQRPVVVTSQAAAIGRPPEQVLEILPRG